MGTLVKKCLIPLSYMTVFYICMIMCFVNVCLYCIEVVALISCIIALVV